MPKKKKAVDAAQKQQNEGFIYQFMFVLIVVLAAVMLLRGVQKYYSYVSYMDLIASASAWAAIGCAVLGTAGLIASAATGKKALWQAGALLLTNQPLPEPTVEQDETATVGEIEQAIAEGVNGV